MTDQEIPREPPPYEHDWTDLDRRKFLKLLGAGAAVTAGAAGGLGSGITGAAPAGAATRPQARRVAGGAAPALRKLLVLDCAGGNDGMSMLVPYAQSAYYAQRPEASIPAASVLPIDAEVGHHPSLAKLHARGLACVQGVGIPSYDLSHFESLRRWWAGDSGASAIAKPGGFLGRVCDAIGDVSTPAVGVSIGFGPSAALVAQQVGTVAFNPYGQFTLPTTGDPVFADAFRAIAQPVGGDPVWTGTARKGASDLVRFVDAMQGLSPGAGGYPNTLLGKQLELAARIFDHDVGVRIIHVPAFFDFDTHKNHDERAAAFLTKIDDTLDRFLVDIAARGLGGTTLVATTSEFGRRGISNNSSGLDHGAANMHCFAGPVNVGRYGQYPSFANLDSGQNLTPTVTLAQYYATIAEGWFGVPASDVLDGSPTPLTGIFNWFNEAEALVVSAVPVHRARVDMPSAKARPTDRRDRARRRRRRCSSR